MRPLPLLLPMWLGAVLALLIAFPLVGAPLVGPEARQRFDEATARFENGLDALEAGETATAQLHFADAAQLYERIATEHAIDSAPLRANAGNAWLLAGRPGEAVLSYRRALLLDPADDAARAGLGQARQRVGVEVAPGTAARWGDRLIGAVAAAGPAPLLWAGALLWAAGWIGLGASFFARGGPWARGAGLAGAAVGLALLGAVAAAAWLQRAGTDGVIVAERVIARDGPSAAAYEPAFDAPMAPGVEISVLERRDGWARVALLDGRQAWVPEGAFEPVSADFGRP